MRWVVVLVVVSVIGLFGMRILAYRNVIDASLTAEQEVEQVLAPFVTELRSMQISNTGGYSIEAASTSSITFYSDYNKDGLVERIRYYMSTTTLMRGLVVPSGNPLTYNPAAESSKEVLHNITGGYDIFSYYANDTDMNGAPLSSPIDVPSVRTIKITVTSDKTPFAPPGPLTFTTSATPRNLRNP